MVRNNTAHESATDPATRFIARGSAEIFSFRLDPEAISRRAQDLYLNSGRREGLCDFNWFQAERELFMEAFARDQQVADDAEISSEIFPDQ